MVFVHDEYTYDECGAIIGDRNKGIRRIWYDFNGNPTGILFANGSITEYLYTANGVKLKTVHRTAVGGISIPLSISYKLSLPDSQTLSKDSTLYVGALEIEPGATVNAKYYFSKGYVDIHGASLVSYNYMVKDHLGNVRHVDKALPNNGSHNIVQVNNYYSYGGVHADKDKGTDVQTHKYNGKELDKMHGLNTYDYGARQYNPVTARWDRMNPLAEKYYSISPYAYCAGNPVKYVDPDGRQLGDFVDEKGKVIGNDGIDDGKMYVLKTSKNEFKEGESDPDPVSGAGVRERTLKQAKNFITQNSGNKDAFAENNIAYQNSVEVQPAAMRRKMVDEVANKDDGKWSTKAENNREYGADLYPWEASVGAINTVLGKGAEVYLNHNGCTCHTHCSGFVYANGRQSGYVQHPSSTDLKMAGEHTCYVFGARNGVTYIYNRTGVLATIPTNKFVNPDKK